jgi:hypothetical protein
MVYEVINTGVHGVEEEEGKLQIVFCVRKRRRTSCGLGMCMRRLYEMRRGRRKKESVAFT